VAILPLADARARYMAAETVSLPEHVVIPGLINLHCHAAMTLMRGLADDLPLMRWLQEAIWPAEARHASHAFVRDGSLLAGAEMLRGGITTCNDMYFFPQASRRSLRPPGHARRARNHGHRVPIAVRRRRRRLPPQGLATHETWRDHP
jgi:5-methylthioadenosine/S-adenosylhomocysteine deaminase